MKSQILSSQTRGRMVLILAVAILMAIPQVLSAAPMQLQFTGTVIRVDGNFSVAPYGISAGTPVSFTYVVDLAAPGANTDSTWYDYFHAEQVGGLRIIGSAAEDVYFSGYRDKYNNQTHFFTGSGREANDWWSSPEVLPEGQYFYVGQYFYGNGGLLHPYSTYSPYAFVRYDLTLTSISAVPLPGALWLLAPALAGLAGMRRKNPEKGTVPLFPRRKDS